MIYTKALALSPLLVGLREEELEALIAPAHEVRYVAGEVIVAEGTPGDTMFMLCEGALTVEKKSAKPDTEVELTVLSELLSFYLETLRDFFEKYSDAHLSITLNIACMLSKRLRKADDQISLLMAERG